MTVPKKILLILLILFMLISMYVLVKYNYRLTNVLAHADTSTQVNTVCKKHSGRVWFVSYADGGVYIANQRALTHSALNKCVDFFMHFGPHSIDEEYFKKHQSILTQPRGAGYWLWKPYVVLKMLEQVPENDFVLYVDVGSLLIKPVDSLIERLGDADILIFKNVHKNKGHVKRDLLKLMDLDHEEVLNALQLQAGYIFARNTGGARKFIKKWLKLCEIERAITDSPSVDEYPSFIDHRHDQAILSLLVLKYPEKVALMEFGETFEYFIQHRRGSVNRGSLLWKPFNNKINYEMTRLEKYLNKWMQWLNRF